MRTQTAVKNALAFIVHPTDLRKSSPSSMCSAAESHLPDCPCRSGHCHGQQYALENTSRLHLRRSQFSTLTAVACDASMRPARIHGGGRFVALLEIERQCRVRSYFHSGINS